jgi:hypothetical protein
VPGLISENVGPYFSISGIELVIMNKKQFKVQASSSRVGHSTIVSAPNFGSKFTAVSSTLSYVYEPPNLSDISASNIVVAFKNLQKKDCATKARALEDLQAYVVSCSACKDGLEDAVLDAWVRLLGEFITYQIVTRVWSRSNCILEPQLKTPVEFDNLPILFKAR